MRYDNGMTLQQQCQGTNQICLGYVNTRMPGAGCLIVGGRIAPAVPGDKLFLPGPCQCQAGLMSSRQQTARLYQPPESTCPDHGG